MLILADARRIPLASGCVQCVVTSPPYFGLRDYGTSGQIGLEATPDAYVASLVEVFREVWRVLADDGVLWLNLGDSYLGGGGFAPDAPCNQKRSEGDSEAWGAFHPASMDRMASRISVKPKRLEGLKPKDLIGIPWRVAFALQADGWYLRSDVIWSKPNPMPESVTDRPTKGHEYLFLLTKNGRYYYDADGIRQRPTGRTDALTSFGKPTERQDNGRSYSLDAQKGANCRSVWTVSTMPFEGAHFATMPEKLVEPCILAGSRLGDRIFDPFIGSGTVGAVAERLGRRWVGTDLNPAYHQLAKRRTAQRGIMFDEGVA